MVLLTRVWVEDDKKGLPRDEMGELVARSKIGVCGGIYERHRGRGSVDGALRKEESSQVLVNSAAGERTASLRGLLSSRGSIFTNV